jgi:hypothetical protein
MKIQFKQGGGSTIPEALREYGMERTGGFQSHDHHTLAQATNVAWYDLEVDARIALPFVATYIGCEGDYDQVEKSEIYLIGKSFVGCNGYAFAKEDVLRLIKGEAYLRDPERNGGSGWQIIDGPIPSHLPYNEYTWHGDIIPGPIPAVKIIIGDNESCSIEDLLVMLNR